jgi:hypothetical protein
VNAQRILIAAVGLAAAVVLFVVLRPDGGDDEAAPTVTAPATTVMTETETAPATTEETPTETEAEPPPPPPPPTATAPVELRVPILVRGGEVEGGIRRITVRRGRELTIVVRADVSDHVHLHGYDILSDVGPGAPAQLRVTADVPGVFEIELEDRRQQIAELVVNP